MEPLSSIGGANEIVFEAVDLLSKANEAYKDHARFMLKHNIYNMPKDHTDRYDTGLEKN
jgi:hypothetical protein